MPPQNRELQGWWCPWQTIKTGAPCGCAGRTAGKSGYGTAVWEKVWCDIRRHTPLMFFFLRNRFHLEIWSWNLLIEEMPRKSTWLEWILLGGLLSCLDGGVAIFFLTLNEEAPLSEVGWNHLHHWVYLPGAGLPPGWEQARVDEVWNY